MPSPCSCLRVARSSIPQMEPPRSLNHRVCWRLESSRGLRHGKQEQVFARGPGTSRSDGFGTPIFRKTPNSVGVFFGFQDEFIAGTHPLRPRRSNMHRRLHLSDSGRDRSGSAQRIRSLIESPARRLSRRGPLSALEVAEPIADACPSPLQLPNRGTLRRALDTQAMPCEWRKPASSA